MEVLDAQDVLGGLLLTAHLVQAPGKGLEVLGRGRPAGVAGRAQPAMVAATPELAMTLMTAWVSCSGGMVSEASTTSWPRSAQRAGASVAAATHTGGRGARGGGAGGGGGPGGREAKRPATGGRDADGAPTVAALGHRYNARGHGGR